MVILEQDHTRFTAVLQQLLQESNAKFVFLIDKSGQQIANVGDMTGVDPTALASLAAGNVAATEGVGQLLGEERFSSLFHEGERESLHLSDVGQKVVLLVVFGERSSLGLVRLRVKQRTPELAAVAHEIHSRAAAGGKDSGAALAVLDSITDEDIDALFGTSA